MRISGRQHRPFQLLTAGYILAAFVPRIVREGMFPDGLTYASIARNMAVGKGSFWEPYFSSSFWLPGNHSPVFHEHPPLMMAVQSLLFRMMGDHWYVEKVYNAVLLGLTLFLLSKIWKVVCGFDRQSAHFSWLVLLLFYLMPKVAWSYPNNMLDSTMAFFCLASVYFSLKALHLSERPVWNLSFSGLFVLLAFLTKGPVGLFPLAVPFLHFTVFGRASYKKFALHQGTLLVAFTLPFVLLLLYAPARGFIEQYLVQQVVGSVAGGREHADVGWMSHLYILGQLSQQLLPPLALSLLTVLVLRFRKVQPREWEEGYTLLALFFLLVGLSGSLPIIVSPKQSSFYLVPSLPYFSLAMVSLMVPMLKRAIGKVKVDSKAWRFSNLALGFGIFAVLVYSSIRIGEIRREEEVVRDLRKISSVVPVGSKIGTTRESIEDFTTQAYFQRYHRIELAADTTLRFFVLDLKKVSSPPSINSGYRRVPIDTERYVLYKTR